MVDKQTSPHPEHQEHKSLESRALIITSEILQRKWLVIGVPLVAILVAVILIWFSSSRKTMRQNAAAAYTAAKSADELISDVYNKYPNTPYGAYALAGAAKDALDNSEYAKARELSEKFLNEYPDNNYAVFVKRYIALSLEAEGKYDKAIDKYKDILENDPRMEPIADSLNIDIGRCYEQTGEYETARSFYRRVSPEAGGSQSVQARFSVWSPEAFNRIGKVEKKEKATETAE